MNVNNLFQEPMIFDLHNLTQIMIREQGWNIFEIKYDIEYDTFNFAIEYLLDDGKFDNTASYDVTVSYGRKDFYGRPLDHAVSIGVPVKR